MLATGTFLNGVIHIGGEQTPAGRMGDPLPASSAPPYAARLPRGPAQDRNAASARRRDDRLGVARGAVGRRRARALLVDDGADFQSADRLPHHPHNAASACGDRARSRLFAAVHGGELVPGPRYCPSIEDKIARFGDRDGHQIFLEPEGLDDPTVYPNGISASLPEATQQAFINAIPGLERYEDSAARLCDRIWLCRSRESCPGLETKRIAGLFFAGQINGTTGYEEAAAQGLVAGLNAAAFAGGQRPIDFDRAEAYLGVMIDDLVTRGHQRALSMFASRAEYGLSLRADDADKRLAPRGLGRLRRRGQGRRATQRAPKSSRRRAKCSWSGR